MPTPHLEAAAGDFAETVLLPGDPLRAKYIAETFLTDVSQINGVRNMLGYTGNYEGTGVSIMGSGMGIPSISIYAKELITEYGVKNLIRVGSCGAVSGKVKVRDVLIGMGCCTDSGVNRARFGGYDFAAVADYDLLAAHVEAARELEIPVRIGNLFSADLFYTPCRKCSIAWKRWGCWVWRWRRLVCLECVPSLERAAWRFVPSVITFGPGNPPAVRNVRGASLA